MRSKVKDSDREEADGVGIVVGGATMSLDGFIAGPGDDMDWVFEAPVAPDAPDELTQELIETTGSVLAGRRSYDVGERGERPETSEVFGGGWSGPEFVLTHRPPASSPRPGLTFLSCRIEEAVATARTAAGAKNVLVIGADVTRQCIDAGLLDELRIYLAPLLLGDGVRLFGSPAGRVALETLAITRSGPLGSLRYRVAR